MAIFQKAGIIYLIIINLAAFSAFGMDKRKAVKKKWRIPERTLLALAAAGGALGALAGMYTFRHKTMHKKFTVGIPLILIAELTAVIWLTIR